MNEMIEISKSTVWLLYERFEKLRNDLRDEGTPVPNTVLAGSGGMYVHVGLSLRLCENRAHENPRTSRIKPRTNGTCERL